MLMDAKAEKGSVLQVEPSIDPRAAERLSKPYHRFVDEMRDLYDFTVTANLVCINAVSEWMRHEPKYSPFQFKPLALVFENPVWNVRGDRETGQSALAVEHRSYPGLILAVDPAGSLFGFKTIDEMPAAIGSRRFVEEAFTKAYSAKHRGIQISAPAHGSTQQARGLVLAGR